MHCSGLYPTAKACGFYAACDNSKAVRTEHNVFSYIVDTRILLDTSIKNDIQNFADRCLNYVVEKAADGMPAKKAVEEYMAGDDSDNLYMKVLNFYTNSLRSKDKAAEATNDVIIG